MKGLAYLNVENLDVRVVEEEMMRRLPDRVLSSLTNWGVLHQITHLQNTVWRGLLEEF